MVTATLNPNLIAFVGDVQGKLNAFEYSTAQAPNRGCTTIIQVGDFWIYDRAQELVKLHRTLRRICPDGINLTDNDYRFIDGNHENSNVLGPDADGLIHLADNLTYLPRGTRAHLAGADLLFFGGVSSTDRTHRTEGKDWWPAENITTDQATRAVSAAAVRTGDTTDQTNRHHLTRVRETAAPRAHVHGHHHTRFAAPVDQTITIALNAHHHYGSVAVLGTTDWS